MKTLIIIIALLCVVGFVYADNSYEKVDVNTGKITKTITVSENLTIEQLKKQKVKLLERNVKDQENITARKNFIKEIDKDIAELEKLGIKEKVANPLNVGVPR